MTEFHQEYQRVFGDKTSSHTIIRKRIACMNPPIPSSICKEEMQDANIDTNEVIIEYIMDVHEKKVKKLKSLFIKSEPNKTYFQHIYSNDDLPVVPEENFIPNKRSQLILTVNQYHLMRRQVMIEL